MEPLREYLKAATAAAHQRVDDAFGRHDITRREGYGRFLLGHAAVLPAMERSLEAAGIDRILPDWAARRRREALARDLAALGLAGPLPRPVTPPDGTARLLGAAYVLEGSRLGAALLLRRAGASGDPAVPAATAYLRHGRGQGLWASFLGVLGTNAAAQDAPDLVVEGAELAFSAFEAAAREVEHDGLAR